MPHIWLDERTVPPIYRFNYRDSRGRKRSGTGTTKLKETQEMAALVEAKHRAIRKGWADAPKSFAQARARKFSDVTKEYLAWGEAQGGRGGRPWSKEHLRVRTYWLEWWQTALGLETLADLDEVLPRAEIELRKLLAKGKAGKTLQNSAESLRAFGRWCKARGLLPGDPLEGMAGFDITPKSTRRALTAKELNTLLGKCAPHRRLLYEVAFTTGLRRGELRALTIEHLDVKNSGLILDAAWTKNRKQGFQPLPAFIVERLQKAAQERVAERLYERIAKEREQRGVPNKVKLPVNPLLYVPEDTARELDRDLEAANIPKVAAGGKIDFHALRVSYVTFVLEAGANPKEAQALARHATAHLTLNVYARARSERLSEVAEKVGEIIDDPKADAVVLATGTDGMVKGKNSGLLLAYKHKHEVEVVGVTSDSFESSATSKLAERVGFEPT